MVDVFPPGKHWRINSGFMSQPLLCDEQRHHIVSQHTHKQGQTVPEMKWTGVSHKV